MTATNRQHALMYELGVEQASAVYQEVIREYVAENDKLQELVRDIWQFTGAACKKYPRLFDPPAQGAQVVLPNAIDAFEQRMRELGIEVSEK